MAIYIVHTSIEQVDRLDEVFATLTSSGWVIPAWLVLLRNLVEAQNENRSHAVE